MLPIVVVTGWRPSGTIRSSATSPGRPCACSTTSGSGTDAWTPRSPWGTWAAPCVSNSTTPTPASCPPATGWGTTTHGSSRSRATSRPRGTTSRSSPRTCRCASRPPRSGSSPRSTGPSSPSRTPTAGPGCPTSPSPPTRWTCSTTRRRCTCRRPPSSGPHGPGAPVRARQGARPGHRRGNVRLVRGDREAFGLRGRSAEQRIALDLLLDPDVGIISMGGRAGTGKSALALCAGLEAVLERRQHQKVMVFRPLYAVGGQSSATCRAARPRR